MIKRVSISLVLVVITLNYIRIVGPFFDYIVNYDYIVTELCVQKDEVVNDCCGSCVVTKNLNKVIEDEREDAPTQGKNDQKSIKELMPHFISGKPVLSLNFASSAPGYFSITKYPLEREHQPDIPPPKI